MLLKSTIILEKASREHEGCVRLGSHSAVSRSGSDITSTYVRFTFRRLHNTWAPVCDRPLIGRRSHMLGCDWLSGSCLSASGSDMAQAQSDQWGSPRRRWWASPLCCLTSYETTDRVLMIPKVMKLQSGYWCFLKSLEAQNPLFWKVIEIKSFIFLVLLK